MYSKNIKQECEQYNHASIPQTHDLPCRAMRLSSMNSKSTSWPAALNSCSLAYKQTHM